MIFFAYVWPKVIFLVFSLVQIQGFSLGVIPVLWLVVFFSLPYYYLSLYGRRNLPYSLSSLLFFSLNVCLALSFFFGFYLGLQGPWPLDGLSWLSYGRSIFFLGLTLILVPLYFLPWKDFFPALSHVTFSSPLREEFIRRLEKSTLRGKLWAFNLALLDGIAGRNLRARLFFLVHVFLSLFIPALQSIVFFLGVWWLEDLRWSFLLLPLSFVSWLHGYFYFYLRHFFLETLQGLREILDKGDLGLGPQAQKDYAGVDTSWARDLFFRMTVVESFFVVLDRDLLFRYVSYLSFFFRWLGWLGLALCFWSLPPFSSDPAQAVPGFILRFFSTSARPPQLRAYRLKEEFKESFEALILKTQNKKVDASHPFLGETGPGETVDVQGLFTHAGGDPSAPSYFLSSWDLMGRPRKQNLIPLDPQSIPSFWVHKEIPSSASFLASPESRRNLSPLKVDDLARPKSEEYAREKYLDCLHPKQLDPLHP